MSRHDVEAVVAVESGAARRDASNQGSELGDHGFEHQCRLRVGLELGQGVEHDAVAFGIAFGGLWALLQCTARVLGKRLGKIQKLLA